MEDFVLAASHGENIDFWKTGEPGPYLFDCSVQYSIALLVIKFNRCLDLAFCWEIVLIKFDGLGLSRSSRKQFDEHSALRI